MQSLQQRILSVAIATLAGCWGWWLSGRSGEPGDTIQLGTTTSAAGAANWQTLGWVSVVLLGVIAVLLGLTSLDSRRSAATLRLDWFVPALRRLNMGQPPSHSFLGRWLRRFVPAWLQSNRQTKQRGPLRLMLRRLGISWLASPVRRFVQALSLLMFAWLFLVVCWPYTAQPQSESRKSADWIFSRIDQASGDFVLQRSEPQKQAEPSEDERTWKLQAGDLVAVFEQSLTEGQETRIGVFAIAQLDEDQIRLKTTGPLTPELLDAFLISSGQFKLYEPDYLAWPSHYSDNLAAKEFIPAELFLVIDPLVSLSTAIASGSWVWSLGCAATILIVCLLIPRGFCGYVCPLGTTIDLFDWAVGKRITRFRVAGDGWWVHLKYYLLAGILIAAMFGVLLSGFFSAIPIITRAMLFLVDPLQNGLARGWHLVPSMGVGQTLSIGMFAAVLCLGFLRPRFWCKYVCPSGAVFSLGNLLRITERKVETSCINCNKCVEICPFDAIKPDFTTRTSDCTLCQSCGGVCPTHAIKFVERWNVVDLKVAGVPPTGETSLGRRGFLSLAVGSTAAAVGGVGMAGLTQTLGANLEGPNAPRPIRPPGSVPEREFLQMCIRCGECFKACPNNVLQAEGFLQGLEGLWTPQVQADWAGCESSCNACGQVCPTGAIRALPLEEKRVARMGLAVVDEATCLPYAGSEACDLCVQECHAAGYHAIEYKQVGTEVDDNGLPLEGTGFLAPVVLDDRCVGCGLCQTRCYAINVKNRMVLSRSAIVVEAGEGREDRLMSGSYLELREQERRRRASEKPQTDHFFVPADSQALESRPAVEPNEELDPFGLGSPSSPITNAPEGESPF